MKKITKSLLMITAAAAIVIGGTSAYFSSHKTATNNTFRAGTMDLQLAKDANGPTGTWENSIDANWNFPDMAPGETPQEATMWLKNNGSIDAKKLGFSITNADDGGTGFEKQVRITKMTFDGQNMLQGGAGATIGAYVAPTNCTVTVSGTKITDAINDSAVPAGSTICVAPGDYNASREGFSEIAVNKGVTIVSMQGPSVTSSIPFNISASNVTVRGFDITGPASNYGVYVHGGVSTVAVKDNVIHNIGTDNGDLNHQGIYLEGNAVAQANFTFSGNTISNVGSANAWSNQGIYVGDTSAGHLGISNVTVKNNVISNILSGTKGAYGFLVNEKPSVSGLIVMNNSISNLTSNGWQTAIGLEGETPNASVTLNDLHDLGSLSTGVRVEAPNTSAASITINQNNFAPNIVLGINNTTLIDVNGQNNWWGDQDPSDQISANVNTTGFLGGAVAGFVGGTDQNSNGFADMQDLRLTPIAGMPVAFIHATYKPFVMGVQVDGPTTGDIFQGANLHNVDLTVTMLQQ